MRITYRTLAALIGRMDDEQKDSDVTMELVTEQGSECYPAELRICGENHDSLDDGHPVLMEIDPETERRDDVATIATEIGID